MRPKVPSWKKYGPIIMIIVSKLHREEIRKKSSFMTSHNYLYSLDIFKNCNFSQNFDYLHCWSYSLISIEKMTLTWYFQNYIMFVRYCAIIILRSRKFFKIISNIIIFFKNNLLAYLLQYSYNSFSLTLSHPSNDNFLLQLY